MSLSDLLAQAHPLVSKHLSPTEPYILFFSLCNGKQRASIYRTSGRNFQQAWKAGVALCQREVQRNKLTVKWLRIDWVREIETTTWGALLTRLKNTKRNYFRLGLSLDADLRMAFLEQEINANAMLYSGADNPAAGLNLKNFTVRAKKRFGADFELDASPEKPVYLFTHEGLFLAQDPALAALPDGKRPVWLPAPSKTGIRWRQPESLNSGRRQINALQPEQVLALIESSSNFLAQQVEANGRFIYGHFPCFGRLIPTYNSLRHASSVYSMLEGWEVTKNESLLDAIRRAIGYLTDTLIQHYPQEDGTTLAFNVDIGGEIKLGANAVSLLALVKYDQLTGDTQYRSLMEALALGIARMQDPETGKFVHVLNDEDLSLKEAFRIVYYDGEAAFGLMRLYGLTKDPRWLSIVEKAFDHFIQSDHWKHHDHWLSYCANELSLHKPEEKYFRFGVQNIAGYLDFILKRETTYPTLLELSMAFEAMLQRIKIVHPEMIHVLEGLDVEKFHRALHHRAHYLLNGFFWPEFAMYFAKPEKVVGSFFIRHHSFRVRIDDIEHYLSGYVAYWKMLGRPESGSKNPVVAWGGDVNLGRRQHYRTAELGPRNVLRIPALQEADLRIVNLECVVASCGEQGTPKGEGGPYYYRARPDMLRVLQEAGIDAVTTANNHSGDYGSEALLQQRSLLSMAGIAQAGTGPDLESAFMPAYLKAGHLTIALFSVDASMPYFAAKENNPGCAYIPLNDTKKWFDTLSPRIQEARRAAHIVLVAVHWGVESRNEPNRAEMKIGHLLIDAGADAVLGASAHTLQGIEIYRNRPIIYNAGDLLFDAVRKNLSDTGLFCLELSQYGVERINFVPVGLGFGFSKQLYGTDAQKASERYSELCMPLGTHLQISETGNAFINLQPEPRTAPIRPKNTIYKNHHSHASAIPQPSDINFEVTEVPAEAQLSPIKIGPLLLLGISVFPREIKKRQMLWIESYWSAGAPLQEDFRFDIRGIPEPSSKMPAWGSGMDHDPCDWMMPTTRWKPGKIYRDFYGLRPPPLSRIENGQLSITVKLISMDNTEPEIELPVKIKLAISGRDVKPEGHGTARAISHTPHRLFIDVVSTGDQNGKILPKTNIHWARTMDVAIARAALALAHGLGAEATESAYRTYLESLPKKGDKGRLVPSVENYLRSMQLPIERPWSAEMVCHFVLGLEHRHYSLTYESEKWKNSRFGMVPVAIPRGAPGAKTPHSITLYRIYSPRIIKGVMSEALTPWHLVGGVWKRKNEIAECMELTITDEKYWHHTDGRKLPKIWELVQELVDQTLRLQQRSGTEYSPREILGTLAQIHWWLSQATPYRRGSAAISDMFTKALFQICGFSTPCWRKGVAPDLEAFCTPLADFIDNYPKFFTRPPTPYEVPAVDSQNSV